MADREFLLFGLSAPLGAFGDIAVGERRATWDVPSKSGTLGLVAAALGIERADREAHDPLDSGLGFAVRQDNPGQPLRDYHTAQAPKARRGRTWRTRREELEADDLNTVLSERIYRVEPLATVSLWVKGPSATSLVEIAAALRRPQFTLYMGRKACPLGWPPRPRIVNAETLTHAFAAYDGLEVVADRCLRGFKPRSRTRGAPSIWFESGAGVGPADPKGLLEQRQRRDGVMNRALWQFTDRTEGRFTFSAPLYGEDAT